MYAGMRQISMSNDHEQNKQESSTEKGEGRKRKDDEKKTKKNKGQRGEREGKRKRKRETIHCSYNAIHHCMVTDLYKNMIASFTYFAEFGS